MAEIEKKIGNYAFMGTDVGQIALNMNWSTEVSQLFGETRNWEGDPVTVAGERVVPWGSDNNMPNAIRNLLERNNLGPGILDRKTGLLYGQGPMLYRVSIENNERVQEWLIDDEIQAWLDTWDYKGFVPSITPANLSGSASLGYPGLNACIAMTAVCCGRAMTVGGLRMFLPIL
jgi:hypothetical protein